ncbi:hypothetical protein F5B22DRAFT_633267 [Xylaria bambusicola]|uniref:uncharacterized protein n=1 Tax=Xylaria bambusicola TaxID=326684 RepID=UPI002007380F|nr:uncharacterized protein F5B22DRAFT_633267 [Xylaria bambusicola]KAI0525890.1 hypothetical protein F5B22DRAFT_633267 [Xylaria bambusicola]
MDSSPLIKAHDHARAASTATHTSETTVAINEHTRAAGEFANAAKDTTSVEALRTLKLLEQHHRRLSELLQAPLQAPSSRSSVGADSREDEKEDAHSISDPATHPTKSLSNEKNAPPKPTLLKQPRYPARDLGASIASNLASARGIRSKYRSQPLNPSVSNTEAPGSLEGGSKKTVSRTRMQDMLDNSDRTTAMPPSDRTAGLVEDSSSRAIQDTSTSSSDEGFSRFYSAFGSIINKISAPLAFAGLPLISEEQAEEQHLPSSPEISTQKRVRVRHSTTHTAEPDIQKLYSKAALRAVAREGHSTNDSFYVVPTSGHTASYASILTFADKEKRRMEVSTHAIAGNLPDDADEDDFVDARESQMSHSPALKRSAGKGTNDIVVEELYLENKSLKDMIDKLSKRLHAFESMSQSSGMRLAESMRLMRPGSPLASACRSGVSEEVFTREINELKQQNQALMKQNEELEKNYSKARANLVRYREKWDQLKAGAKARRAGSAQGNSEIVDEGLRSPHLA